MKISFFKEDSQLFQKATTIYGIIKSVNLNRKNDKLLRLFIRIILIILTTAGMIFNLKNMHNVWIVLAIALFETPMHEFCHVLFAVIDRKKVEAVRFFPTGKIFSKGYAAYVVLDFCIMKKYERILLDIFPVLILTVIPGIIAVFVPAVRAYMIFLLLLNLEGSTLDLNNAVIHLRAPKNYIYMYNNGWYTIPPEEIVIYYIVKPAKSNDFIIRQFELNNTVLKEVMPDENDTRTIKVTENCKSFFGIL